MVQEECEFKCPKRNLQHIFVTISNIRIIMLSMQGGEPKIIRKNFAIGTNFDSELVGRNQASGYLEKKLETEMNQQQ